MCGARGGLRFCGLFGGRQENGKRRARAGFAFELECSPVSTDDSQDGGHSQPAPRSLGREERLEDSPTGCLVHAAPGVGDFKLNVPSGRKFVLHVHAGQVFRVGIDQVRGDADRALLGADGVGGVGDEVHHHLADLCGVGLDGGQIVGQFVLDRCFA